MKLAKHYQCIKQALKKISRNKFVQDKNAERSAAQKNNKNNRHNKLAYQAKQSTIDLSTINVAPAQANINFTSYMAHLFQLHTLLAAFLSVSMQTTTIILAATSGPWLSKKKVKKLKKFGKCFNSKQKDTKHGAACNQQGFIWQLAHYCKKWS